MRLLRWIVLTFGITISGFSLVHPYGYVKSAPKAKGPLLDGAAVTPAPTAIFERSCANCHSDETNWPAYSYVAPMSWLIERDVRSGRHSMNLSRWASYAPEQKIDILTQMAAVVRARVMPLPQYLYLHPEAKLSDADVKAVSDWAHKERSALRAPLEAGTK